MGFLLEHPNNGAGLVGLGCYIALCHLIGQTAGGSNQGKALEPWLWWQPSICKQAYTLIIDHDLRTSSKRLFVDSQYIADAAGPSSRAGPAATNVPGS